MAFLPFQQFRITGFVKDSGGAPVTGATVMEKRTHHFVLTGTDGSFSLQVSGQQAVLIIQMVGYEQQELSLNADGKPVNIELKPSVQNLNEVVVTGYGIQRKKDVTGSVTTISGAVDYKSNPQQGFYEDKETRIYRGNAGKTPCSDSSVFNTEEYDAIVENPFLTAMGNPLSTFSIDVDAGSYSNTRRFLQKGRTASGRCSADRRAH